VDVVADLEAFAVVDSDAEDSDVEDLDVQDSDVQDLDARDLDAQVVLALVVSDLESVLYKNNYPCWFYAGVLLYSQ
jgi:hypothetical protein